MNKDKMKLEEAVELLKEMQSKALEAYNNLKGNYIDKKAKDKAEAIEIVLQELENSIPKKKIEDSIKLFRSRDDFDYVGTEWRESDVVEFLQELLEDK